MKTNNTGLIYENGVSYFEPQFLSKVDALASKHAIPTEYLLTAMSFESAGTFSPSKRNAATGEAVGLIQFMEQTAKDLGTSTKALSGLTANDQMSFVEKYFEKFKGKLQDFTDVYMAILLPKYVGAADETAVIDQAFTPKRYQSNSGLDINLDGVITKEEASAKAFLHFPKVQAMLERTREKFGMSF